MSQVDVAASVGYSLKLATVALRAAIDAELRCYDLSVPQYASLELLAQQPGITNADLACAVSSLHRRLINCSADWAEPAWPMSRDRAGISA